MKFIFFIALAYFCLNQVISTPTGITKGENIPAEILKSQEVRNIFEFIKLI